VCRFGDVGREKAAMTKSSNLVLREDSGGVASLSLNRP
jgi:hypothetical protein